MLTWLGKQHLGHHDRHEVTGKDSEPLLTVEAFRALAGVG